MGKEIHNQKKSGEETRAQVRQASREAEKRAKQKPEDGEPLNNPFFAYRGRRFPIWQRLVALFSLCVIALVAGLMFGYGGLGHGSPWAVFEPRTWNHILDFLK
ncbi:MAG: DNA-directed RNA polymerase subunit beta [Sporolactobacillus sp.]